ncbi:hypothetical protein YWIDRAFT_07937 [Streptomyces sp. SceaMP-e96]|uniref:hypothetical protein n=1 Tax=Streptomyces TaxID=1883 RepID=UPI0008237EB4|nr:MULTISPECIES: hypothetical protein [unclassified Streptomyces]MYT18257.1 hypothetical protein [Streptomyces sp. SID4951]SCK54004.1 hypothetical protein YWIDRAFT_07937 [Streptomyces sp. SceaMP-e96]
MGGFNEAELTSGTVACRLRRNDSLTSLTVLLFPVNIHGPQDPQLLSKPADKRCRLKGSGTTSVKRAR